MQKAGLINCHRGELKLLDRVVLKTAACSCCVVDKLLHTELSAMKD